MQRRGQLQAQAGITSGKIAGIHLTVGPGAGQYGFRNENILLLLPRFEPFACSDYTTGVAKTLLASSMQFGEVTVAVAITLTIKQFTFERGWP